MLVSSVEALMESSGKSLFSGRFSLKESLRNNGNSSDNSDKASIYESTPVATVTVTAPCFKDIAVQD
ncbi:hypothetical protein KIN20_028233 [Parelaphostrongylus tenuis]|uniref:Uncharacterized protein n=1 Tax=Parelaphostrongylus tenuis TaxID=148309 RepID=A0AAD5WEI9_PARTN|nr:hypothetical protein KIN20_028233 [Parelaphostrongylus tenuis]